MRERAIAGSTPAPSSWSGRMHTVVASRTTPPVFLASRDVSRLARGWVRISNTRRLLPLLHERASHPRVAPRSVLRADEEHLHPKTDQLRTARR